MFNQQFCGTSYYGGLFYMGESHKTCQPGSYNILLTYPKSANTVELRMNLFEHPDQPDTATIARPMA